MASTFQQTAVGPSIPVVWKHLNVLLDVLVANTIITESGAVEGRERLSEIVTLSIGLIRSTPSSREACYFTYGELRTIVD